MFNFQKTPKTIPEEHKPIVTKIVDDRDISALDVYVNKWLVGNIVYCDGEWRYSPLMNTGLSPDSMRIILSKLTELNEQELNYE